MAVGSRSGNNLTDQQTQTPGEGVTVALRTQLKNATRNIKNRWSSSGADALNVDDVMASEEAQALLSKAVDAPLDTPTHQRRNILTMPNYPPVAPVAAVPPTSQLQRAINHTLSSESKMLSKPRSSAQDPMLQQVDNVRAETIC